MKRKFPHVLTLLMAIMVIFTVMTWIVPAGKYERESFKNKQVVVPGTYQRVEQSGQGVMDFLTAPCKGLVAAGDIVAFVFLVAGAFGIVAQTGAIEASLSQVIRFAGDHPEKKILVVPGLMVLFSLGGSTFGMAEEVLVFVMLTVPLARALGYDAIVGIAIPFVGAGAGFAGAFINPFTVGVAQGIAGLAPGSGFKYRVICWCVLTLVAVLFVARYAHTVQKEPARSLVAGLEGGLPEESEGESPEWNHRSALIMGMLMASLGLLIYGVQYWGWYIEEIAGLFLGIGLVSGLLGGLSAEDTVSAFIKGATDVIVVALIVGFARGLLVLAEQGAIIDTILHALAGLADGVPANLSVLAMFAFQSVLNFFVPSGSGQAALTMPLMAPLSDLLGVSRQSAVLAFQFGDGISNLIIPTSGITMGLLEICRIPYDRWFKFALPLVCWLTLAAAILLLCAGYDSEFTIS